MKYSFLIPLFLFISCEFKVDLGKNKGDKENASLSKKIKNNIELKENGLKVSQAFLLYDDEGLVPETNLTKVKQPLRLRLVIDSGWTVQNGTVKIGGSEKVETSDGEVILNEQDLFVNNENITAENAKIITFKVEIDQVTKLYDYYKVSFRLWDKISNRQVSGFYKFNIE